jgi:hypothetical protein
MRTTAGKAWVSSGSGGYSGNSGSGGYGGNSNSGFGGGGGGLSGYSGRVTASGNPDMRTTAGKAWAANNN